MGAGAGGFCVGGPVGAAAAGIGAGVYMDTVYTAATHEPQGILAGVGNVVKNPSAGTFFLTVRSFQIVFSFFNRSIF